MANQIGPPRAPIRVLGIPDTQIDVSGPASTQPLAAFAWHSNRLANPDASRNSHRVGLRFLLARAGIGSPHRNGPHGPLERFIKRDEYVPLNILTSQRWGILLF
jgi:hypothetical protein